jgi:hypothetical protein
MFVPREFKANPTDHEFAIKAYQIMGSLLATGNLKPNPTKKYPQGLAGIPQGFKDAETGKVRKRKFHEILQ